MKQPTVFLGGTYGGNTWRDEIVIPGLIARGVGPEVCFDPVANLWSDEIQSVDAAKRAANYLLYAITSPAPRTGPLTANVSASHLAEMIMHLYDDAQRTVVIFDFSGMAVATVDSLRRVAHDVQERFPHAPIFTSYEEALDWLAAQLLITADDESILPGLEHDTIPTLGEWYRGLPRVQKVLFNGLRLAVGDLNAIAWCGYHRAKRRMKEEVVREHAHN